MKVRTRLSLNFAGRIAVDGEDLQESASASRTPLPLASLSAVSDASPAEPPFESGLTRGRRVNTVKTHRHCEMEGMEKAFFIVQDPWHQAGLVEEEDIVWCHLIGSSWCVEQMCMAG